MRATTHEQRQLDADSGDELDRAAIRREATARHTPGPWVVRRDGRPNGRGGEIIGIARPTAGGGEEIVLDGRPLGNVEANARLIAAAPALLEALRETLAAMRVLRGRAFTGSRIPYERDPAKIAADAAEKRASAALAAARGQP